jgi:hypothetical protein
MIGLNLLSYSIMFFLQPSHTLAEIYYF